MPENQKFKELLNKAKKSTTKSTTAKFTTKAPAKNRVVTTSKTAEIDSKNKILATQAAYNAAVDEKSLSKTQKAVIATGLTLAVATAVVVPLSLHLINTNKMFDITISSNYHMESIENDSISVEPGTLISELTPISREGFVFKGWYKDFACTEMYPLDYEIKEDDVVYALLEVEVVDISLNLYINGQLTTINTQSGKTLEQAFEENGVNIDEISIPGHHLVGLFKDPQGEKTYPNGYIIKKSDSSIYALFEMDTYLITFPLNHEGYYIMDTSGELITSNQRITYGQDFSFKLRIADGYFDNGLKVTANGEIIEAENETYTFTQIGSNFNIEVSGIKKIEDVNFTVVVNGTSTTYNTSTQMTLREFFTQANLNYTEENTSGIFTNADLTESISFDATIDKDATYYIYIATTEKLAFTEIELSEDEAEIFGFTNGYLVSAVDYNITGDVVIPAYYNGKPVVGINEYAFCNIDGETDETTGFPVGLNISSIVLPNTIKVILPCAFACTQVDYINIPEGVVVIMEGAFIASNISKVVLPSSVTIINEAAFAMCTNLTEIHIPNSVTTIGTDAFAECTSLTIYADFGWAPGGWDDNWNSSDCPVVWNEDLRFDTGEWQGYYVGNGAVLSLYTGTSTDVIIPSEINEHVVTTIESGLFSTDLGLNSVKIPNTVTTIRTEAFNGLTTLTEINIPSSITLIGENAFKGCANLTIYADFYNMPSSWNKDWNSSNCKVVWKYDFEVNNFIGYYSGDEAILTSYVGTSTDVVVPKEINGYVVKSFDKNLLSGISCTSLFIPSTLENVRSSSSSSGSPGMVHSSSSGYFYNVADLILCDAASKPSSWSYAWNSRSYSYSLAGFEEANYTQVIWNVKEVRQNENWKYVVHNNNTITLLKYIGGRQKIIVPTSIDGMNVTTLNCNLFDNTSITKVCLTKCYNMNIFLNSYQSTAGSKTNYYSYVFQGCSNLTIYVPQFDYNDLLSQNGYSDDWAKYSSSETCNVVVIPYNGTGYDWGDILDDCE